MPTQASILSHCHALRRYRRPVRPKTNLRKRLENNLRTSEEKIVTRYSESASLRTHWALVVMDQYSRRIIRFGVHAGTVDGVALCRMFNRAIRCQLKMPK